MYPYIYMCAYCVSMRESYTNDLLNSMIPSPVLPQIHHLSHKHLVLNPHTAVRKISHSASYDLFYTPPHKHIHKRKSVLSYDINNEFLSHPVMIGYVFMNRNTFYGVSPSLSRINNDVKLDNVCIHLCF